MSNSDLPLLVSIVIPEPFPTTNPVPCFEIKNDLQLLRQHSRDIDICLSHLAHELLDSPENPGLNLFLPNAWAENVVSLRFSEFMLLALNALHEHNDEGIWGADA